MNCLDGRWRRQSLVFGEPQDSSENVAVVAFRQPQVCSGAATVKPLVAADDYIFGFGGRLCPPWISNLLCLR